MSNVIFSAIKAEDHHIRYFNNLANRFRTFDIGVSWLFTALAEEGEKNKQELIMFSDQLKQKKIGLIIEDNYQNANKFDRTKHFFVIDKEMALNLMEKAIHIKYIHQLFYEQCWLTEIDPLLRLFFERLSLSEKQHAQVLEESRERFYTDIYLDIHQV